jgi:hypothetical protein
VQPTLTAHIISGGIAIVAGYVAVFARKGGRVHRSLGMAFVYAMFAMSLSASALGLRVGRGGGAIFAAYLVVTAVTTVRPRTERLRRLETVMAGMMIVMGLAGMLQIALGPGGARNGAPAPVAILLTAVVLLAPLSDLRVLRMDALPRPARLRRHLWRMCFAMFMATGSFFLGQADEIPEGLRIMPLLAVPAVLPLLLMAYWLWRVPSRGRHVAGSAAARSRDPGPRTSPAGVAAASPG